MLTTVRRIPDEIPDILKVKFMDIAVGYGNLIESLSVSTFVYSQLAIKRLWCEMMGQKVGRLFPLVGRG